MWAERTARSATREGKFTEAQSRTRRNVVLGFLSALAFATVSTTAFAQAACGPLRPCRTIDGMRPADEIEAMLAVQMVATDDVAMDMLARAKRADRLPILQESGSLAVKLLRTYTAQLEALARLRRGGEQRVIVQHVHINEGGQAIVGAVNHPWGR